MSYLSANKVDMVARGREDWKYIYIYIYIHNFVLEERDFNPIRNDKKNNYIC